VAAAQQGKDSQFVLLGARLVRHVRSGALRPQPVRAWALTSAGRLVGALASRVEQQQAWSTPTSSA
jgi:hypothetical protein